MDCRRERYNIRVTGITGLNHGLGLQGRGNALVESGKKRNDPADKLGDLEICVGCSAKEMSDSSRCYWDKTEFGRQVKQVSIVEKDNPVTFTEKHRKCN